MGSGRRHFCFGDSTTIRVLVRQDHKKLGRIPDDGGPRLLGRSTNSRRVRDLGYDHFEVVVDDATGLSYVAQVPDESTRTSEPAPCGSATFQLTIDRNATIVDAPTRSAIRARAYDRLKPYGEEVAMLERWSPGFKDGVLRGTSAWANAFLGRAHTARLRPTRATRHRGHSRHVPIVLERPGCR